MAFPRTAVYPTCFEWNGQYHKPRVAAPIRSHWYMARARWIMITDTEQNVFGLLRNHVDIMENVTLTFTGVSSNACYLSLKACDI